MRTPLMFLIASLSIACSTLEGEWDGTMECESESNAVVKYGAEFVIAENEYGDTEFEGIAENALRCRQDNDPDTEDIDCNFVMQGTVEPTQQSGQQDLLMRVDSCLAVVPNGNDFGSIGFGCENPRLAKWDGRRRIKIIHQTSGDIGCKFILTRQ